VSKKKASGGGTEVKTPAEIFKTTQLARALAMLPSSEVIESLHARHLTLRSVLDEAQNQPPLGDADGSIDEAMWTKLRSVELRLSAFIEAVDEVTESLLHGD
jgi:hypothetical protein